MHGRDARWTPRSSRLENYDAIYSCIRAKAKAVAKLTAHHRRQSGDGAVFNPHHYLAAILDRPNPLMTMQEFISFMVWQCELYSVAHAYVERDPFTGVPIAVYPLRYQSIQVSEYDGEYYYTFDFRGDSKTVHYSDVIAIRRDYHDDEFSGAANVSGGLLPLLDVIDAADQGLINAVRKSALVRFIAAFNNGVRPDEAAEMVAQLENNYLRSDTASGVIVSDAKYTLTPVTGGTQYVPDAAISSGAIQRIQSFFGVNDAILRNEWTEDIWNAFYEAEVEPYARALSDGLSYGLIGSRELSKGDRVIFAATGLVYASMSTKLALKDMVDRGAMTPNEWREVMNLPPIDGGDQPIRRLDTAVVDDEQEENQ